MNTMTTDEYRRMMAEGRITLTRKGRIALQNAKKGPKIAKSATDRVNGRGAKENPGKGPKNDSCDSPTRAMGNGRKTREEKLNCTELRFLAELEFGDGKRGGVFTRDDEHVFVMPQPPRFFELPKGDTYTPDFLVFNTWTGKMWSVEVKGGYRGPGWEQGYERYKRAAEIYDGRPFRFVMATWTGDDWKLEKWS